MNCYQYSIQAIFNSRLDREKQFDKSVHVIMLIIDILPVAYFSFALMGFGDLLSFLPRFRDFEIFLMRFRDFSFSLPRFRDLTPLYLPPFHSTAIYRWMHPKNWCTPKTTRSQNRNLKKGDMLWLFCFGIFVILGGRAVYKTPYMAIWNTVEKNIPQKRQKLCYQNFWYFP